MILSILLETDGHTTTNSALYPLELDIFLIIGSFFLGKNSCSVVAYDAYSRIVTYLDKRCKMWM